MKPATISNCFIKSFENTYVKEVNAECDDFSCFEINTKFDEHLLFDLVEKYENESFKNEETNDNSIEEMEEDIVITEIREYEYARKLEKYFQANFPDKMNKIFDLIDEIQGEKASRRLKITDFIMCQINKNCDK